MEALNKTILIVEDERPLSMAISAKLQSYGFDVVTARSVEQAIDYLESIDHIDAIWLDHYSLGKSSGLDLLQQVKTKEVWQNIPVFAVTNTGGIEKKSTYMKFGAKEYFIKSENRLDTIIERIKDDLSVGGVDQASKK